MPNSIFTIGHSNHPIETFLGLLQQHAVQAVADVRSTPYSQYNPHFDRETLKASLRLAGIKYVFLGKELGARSDDPTCYLHGKVQFQKLAETMLFQAGLSRVLEGAATLKLTLLCAEKEPLDCHRTILVARNLLTRGATIQHILADGTLEPHAATIDRLMQLLHLDPHAQHLFRSPEQLVEEAYTLQEKRIAYDSSATSEAA